MSQSGEAAEQLTNMMANVTVKGVECVTNLAGRGALSLATFLIAAVKDEKRMSGKTRMRSFNGKPTKVFVIPQKDLKLFAQEAKKYGVLYAAVLDKRNPDGLCDIVVSDSDAARVDRIAERFALSTVDVDKIREDIIAARKLAAERPTRAAQAQTQHERPDPAADKPAHTVGEKDLDEMLGEPTPPHRAQPTEIPFANPTGRTGKSSPSDPTSKSSAGFEMEFSARPSVRREIQKIKDERQPKQPERQQQRQQQHRSPKKQNKSKGR